MITLPYVTTASFKAYPTFLDLQNLRSGNNVAADQDAELFNELLKSAAWVDNVTQMSAGDGTLSAHSRVENTRLRVARDGRISYHPDHNPVTAVTALSLGTSPNQLAPVTDLTNLWVEDGVQIVGWPGGGAAPGMAALQFGAPVTTNDVYAQWTYTAGYANTLLGAAVLAGVSAITVADATGITKGTVLRIWDPGKEEAVTVSAAYVGGTALPLTAGLKNAHDPAATPIGVSAVPADVHLASILHTCHLLQRPDSDAEDTYEGTTARPNAGTGGTGRSGSRFLADALALLGPYSRTR